MRIVVLELACAGWGAVNGKAIEVLFLDETMFLMEK